MPSIYIIRNTVNKKVYIGQTINTSKFRFNHHLSMVYSNGCSALYSAMKKYGKEKFYVETLEEGNFDIDTLNSLEIMYIKKYNSLSPKGYNLTAGGKNGTSCEESNTKRSQALKGRKVTWADKVSKSIKTLWKNPEYRERILSARQPIGKRGKYKKHSKPLRIDLPLDKIQKMYDAGISINEIANVFHVSFYTIQRRINK